MSYINLLNRFWGKREELRLSSVEADLYLFLLHCCNRSKWENPFCLPTKEIQTALNLTRKTINLARVKLENVGLIKFQQGTTKGKSAKYLLCDCVSVVNTIDQECVYLVNTIPTDCVSVVNTFQEKEKRKEKENFPSYSPYKEKENKKEKELDKTFASLITCAHAREKEQTIQKLREHFSNEMVMEGQMKNNGIYDVSVYFSLCEEVLNDFIATKDEDFKFDSEAKRHFANLLRIKKREKEKQRGAGASVTREEKREQLMQSALNSINQAIQNETYNKQQTTTTSTF